MPLRYRTEDPTYHDYQRVLDLKGSTVHKRRSTSIKHKITKTKNGCFSCKRRKKKCDEQKPVCRACIRNSLACSWPEHIDINDKPAVGGDSCPVVSTEAATSDLLRQSPLEPLNESMGTSDHESISSSDFNFDFHSGFILDQFLDIQQQNITIFNEVEKTASSQVMQPQSQYPRQPELSLMEKPELKIPGVEMSEMDLICYDAFLNIMIKSISYSHCNPMISPSALLIPFVKTNYIVRQVAFACGASLLTYHNDFFKEEATRRYNYVVGLLIKELQNPRSGFGDHVFVSVQLLQTLCLRDKNLGFNITLCAAHFSSSYAIIKKRFLKNALPLYHNPELRYTTTPLDRLLADHFILHYPLNIMLCRFSKLADSVPSPFQFFERFYSLLRHPLYYAEDSAPVDTDPWLNHPVLGVGLKAQMIAAKCSWICRFLKTPSSEEELVSYFSLLVQTTNEIKRLSEILIKNPSLKPSEKSNIHYSKTVLYADLIILKKLCYYQKTTIESLQDTVNHIIEEETMAKECDPTGCISSIWTLFIGASAASTVTQKKYFSNSITEMANQVHSTICLKILKYLDIVWVDDIGTQDDESKLLGPVQHVGFEFLFDSKVLDIISD